MTITRYVSGTIKEFLRSRLVIIGGPRYVSKATQALSRARFILVSMLAAGLVGECFFLDSAESQSAESHTAKSHKAGTSEPRYLGELSEITQKFIDFLDAPTSKAYLEGLRYVASAKHLDAFSDDCLRRGEELLNNDKFNEAIELVDGPDCIQTIFVPRHHYLISAAYRKLGDVGQANGKRPLGGMLLRAIAGTGMGTRAKPYQVLHLAAQEDFVDFHLKDKIASRATEQAGATQLDKLELASGKQIWFEPAARNEVQKKAVDKGSANVWYKHTATGVALGRIIGDFEGQSIKRAAERECGEKCGDAVSFRNGECTASLYFPLAVKIENAPQEVLFAFSFSRMKEAVFSKDSGWKSAKLLKEKNYSARPGTPTDLMCLSVELERPDGQKRYGVRCVTILGEYVPQIALTCTSAQVLEETAMPPFVESVSKSFRASQAG
jgi:hypothetical protein